MLFEELLENRVKLDAQGRVRIVQDLSIMANLQGPTEVALVVPLPEDRNMGIVMKLVPIDEISEEDISYGKRCIDEKNRICFSQLLKVEDLNNYVWVVHGGRVCMKYINENSSSKKATTIKSSTELLNLVAKDVTCARNKHVEMLYNDFLCSVKKVIDLLRQKSIPDDLSSVQELQISYRVEGEGETAKIYRTKMAKCLFGYQEIIYENEDVFLGVAGVVGPAFKELLVKCQKDPYIATEEFEVNEDFDMAPDQCGNLTLGFSLNYGMKDWKKNGYI